VKSRGQSATERGRLASFFGLRGFELKSFVNRQDLDFEAFRGRVLSASYIPKPPDERYPRVVDELERVFARHQVSGTVRIDYETNLYLGQL
jgi:hypothetical protein